MTDKTIPKGGTEIQYESWLAHVPASLQRAIHLSVSAVLGPKRPLKPHVFWAHQAADQPSVQNLRDPLVQQGIDVFVFVSEWQREQYIGKLGVPRERSHIIRNAIEPIPVQSKPSGPLQLIYTATPFRGLDVLLDAFAALPERGDVELHIYSGMKLYGREAEDARFTELYDQARSMSNVQYHGVVSNTEVRNALQNSHIFAYPCTWEETSCIAMIEALSAGCLTVAPALAALPETAAAYARLYPYTTDRSAHVARFQTELSQTIADYGSFLAANQVAHFAEHYSWDTRSVQWVALLEQILESHGQTI